MNAPATRQLQQALANAASPTAELPLQPAVPPTESRPARTTAAPLPEDPFLEALRFAQWRHNLQRFASTVKLEDLFPELAEVPAEKRSPALFWLENPQHVMLYFYWFHEASRTWMGQHH